MLKDKIRSGTAAFGTWVSLGSSAIAEIFARAGADWVTIDLEHSVIDLGVAAEMIRAVDLCGTTPLIRLPSNDAILVKRVMDAGAHGVIAPDIRSKAEAEALVASVYYPPTGRRGVGLARAQGYGASFSSYLTWLKEHAVVLVQIEHINAVLNLREIITVPGIDGFLIGPYDLSASLGKPGDFNNPEFIHAMNEIKTVSARNAVSAGIHVVEPNPLKLAQAIEDGFKLIAYSVDIRILDCAVRSVLNGVTQTPR